MTNDTDVREFLQRLADETDPFPVDSRPWCTGPGAALPSPMRVTLMTVAALVWMPRFGQAGSLHLLRKLRQPSNLLQVGRCFCLGFWPGLACLVSGRGLAWHS